VTHLVAISPHLDDAAFSAGGTLAAHAGAGGRVTIVTCFTGNVARPQGFALACQLDKGVAADADYMALRREEDLAACAVIGAAAVHLPFLEAPHRGYGSAPELFAPRRPDDDLLFALGAELSAAFDALEPDVILAPSAIGDHVDHWMVRDALAMCGRRCLLWEDWPYVRRSMAPSTAVPIRRHRLTPSDRSARLAMCAAYASQLGFQFGGLDQLACQVADVDEERFYSP
jgi:LmbE family N-acetylglucosaminyl deacetylase